MSDETTDKTPAEAAEPEPAEQTPAEPTTSPFREPEGDWVGKSLRDNDDSDR
jgi:hypothetical protein